MAISPLLTTPLKISGIAYPITGNGSSESHGSQLKKLIKVIEKEDSLEIIPNLNKLKEIAKKRFRLKPIKIIVWLCLLVYLEVMIYLAMANPG